MACGMTCVVVDYGGPGALIHERQWREGASRVQG
jgi:hypothetical protein